MAKQPEENIPMFKSSDVSHCCITACWSSAARLVNDGNDIVVLIVQLVVGVSLDDLFRAERKVLENVEMMCSQMLVLD